MTFLKKQKPKLYRQRADQWLPGIGMEEELTTQDQHERMYLSGFDCDDC